MSDLRMHCQLGPEVIGWREGRSPAPLTRCCSSCRGKYERFFIFGGKILVWNEPTLKLPSGKFDSCPIMSQSLSRIVCEAVKDPGENWSNFASRSQEPAQLILILMDCGAVSWDGLGSIGTMSFRPGTRCSVWATRERNATKYRPALPVVVDGRVGRSNGRKPLVSLVILILGAIMPVPKNVMCK